MRIILIFAVLFTFILCSIAQQIPTNFDQFGEDVVVADAVFRGVYVGVVRMIQKVSDGDSGYPTTKVLVRVKYADNDSITDNHMWHVEHDPIAGVDCADVNKHFAPFGMQKWANYTTYCSFVTPDYCEVGDISTKTTLTSVGKNVINWYDVENLPVVGPQTGLAYTCGNAKSFPSKCAESIPYKPYMKNNRLATMIVIGHSVNIHGGSKSKIRQACANIQLNERMTPARIVKIKVKIDTPLDVKLVEEARMRISKELGISLDKVQTAGGLYTSSDGCTDLQFLIYGKGTYNEDILSEIQKGKRGIGALSPVGCTIDGTTITRQESNSESCGKEKNEKENGDDNDELKRDIEVIKSDDIGEDDIIVADAVFRGVYVGIVRMVQIVTASKDGFPVTTVIVRVKHAANDSTSNNHMWHVEHDPIADTTCAAKNKHFAPFGIQKTANYTTYCSQNTPDYCEIGDISTKTTFTSLGKNLINQYGVPLLPLVGPSTVIGHSVNIHGGAMSKVRRACANIVLNTRMTNAKIVSVPVKFPGSLSNDDLYIARIKISRALKVPISKVHTAERFDMVTTGCTKLKFLLFSRGSYCVKGLNDLKNGEIDIGILTPSGCTTYRTNDSGQSGNGSGFLVTSKLMLLIALLHMMA